MAGTYELVLRVKTREMDERLLAEVERYSEWMDLAHELAASDGNWLVRLT